MNGPRPFDPMDWLDALQWPAMAVTVSGAWLVASGAKAKRHWGFWLFLLGNALWMAWGWHDGAYALIALQVCLAALNIRGTWKTNGEHQDQQEGACEVA